MTGRRGISMKKLLYIVFAIAFLALVTRCGVVDTEPAPEGDSDDGVTLTLKLGSLEAGLEKKELKNIKTFRIRVYAGTPNTEAEKALFDSLDVHGCFKAGGTDVRIQDLKAGENRFVYYQGYSDAKCTELYAVGIRGGITIEGNSDLIQSAKNTVCTGNDTCETEIHPDAYCDCELEGDDDEKYCKDGVQSVCMVSPPVFVPLYVVGKFNSLPVPSDSLKSSAAKVSCDTDVDCQDSVHRASTCSDELGYCTMEGLFPFSPARARAFHTADVLSNGKILYTGGFNHVRDGNSFYAAAPFFEVFNPRTGLFEKPLLQDNWGGQNVGLHRSATAGSDRLLITGGISELILKYQQGEELKLRWDIPKKYDCGGDSCVNFSKTLIVANYVEGTPFDTKSGLPDRLLGHRSALVNHGDITWLLLTGGYVFSDSGQLNPTNQHTLCNAADILANEKEPTCIVSTNSEAFPLRYSHADACLVGGGIGNACTEYVVFAGVEEGEPSGEVFSSDGDPFNQLLSFTEITSLNKALFPELVKAATVDEDDPAKLYSFGGVSSVAKKAGDGNWMLDFPAPDMQPQQVNVNLANFSLTTGGLDLMDLQPAGEVYRLFHTVSVLEQEGAASSVMLSGGIGDDALPTRSVLFFDDIATHALTYVAKTKMKIARFGHTATVLPVGLLKGAVLVVGGFTVVDKATGTIEYAQGAEIYIP